MGKVFLVPVLWEQEPLLASGTFQAQIDPPEETEILLGILWSRIGSPLPESILRPDGTRYDSGTAFEFESALAGHQKKGKPDILLYRKLGAPSVSLDDRKELAERLEQMDALDAYVKKQLMAEDGSYVAAFHTFETEEQFESILKTHLRKLVLKQLEKPEEKQPEEGQPTEDNTEVPPVLPDTFSVAVLPFDNMSKDPEQEFFVDGLTEDVITELARFKDLDVIARNSTFQYKGRSVDVRQVGQELGAHYVLEGSVRKAGNALRVTGQLLDAGDGSHLWAETYDRNLSETSIFEVQDELSQGIASVIGDLWGVLGQVRLGKAIRETQGELDSDQAVAFVNAYYRTLSQDDHLQAREVIERAVQQDSDNANVWAQLANVTVSEFWYSHNPLPNSLDRALKAAQRAVELDPGSDRAYASLAGAHCHRGEMRAFRTAAERVLQLAPNSGMRLHQIGMYFYQVGDQERGMELMDKGMRFMMRTTTSSPPGWSHIHYFLEHYRNGRYEEALEEAYKMEMPRFWGMHTFVAAASARLGLHKEMQASVEQLLQLWPEFPTKVQEAIYNLTRLEEVTGQLIVDLRQAGLDIPDQLIPKK